MPLSSRDRARGSSCWSPGSDDGVPGSTLAIEVISWSGYYSGSVASSGVAPDLTAMAPFELPAHSRVQRDLPWFYLARATFDGHNSRLPGLEPLTP